MTIVILQPGYLPWLGFFEQLWKSDIFVFYDDVQFDKNGWRNRNRIKTQHGTQWLTVPVHVNFGDKVKDIKIANTISWKGKHLKSIEAAYHRAPFFEEYFCIIQNVLSKEWNYLVNLDVALIHDICGALNLERKLFFSSELHVEEKGKVERLVGICKALGADTFYEGAAGRNYIDGAAFQKEGIKVEYQNYEHPIYRQLHGDFVSHLSVLDLIFNEGPKSLEILTKSSSRI